MSRYNTHDDYDEIAYQLDVAIWGCIHLERGVAMAFRAVDPDQRKEVLVVKEALFAALDLLDGIVKRKPLQGWVTQSQTTTEPPSAPSPTPHSPPHPLPADNPLVP